MYVTSRHKPVSATIGTVFGGLWALIAALALPFYWRFPVALLAALVTSLLIVRLWRTSQTASSSGARLFGRKAYQLAVVAEVAAIYGASVTLPHVVWQGYSIQIVGVIVGLHFIGLWVATRSKRFLGIAGGMCAISAIAIALPEDFGVLNVRNVITGLGNAFVLWLGASRLP
jgi:hypothetical protein